MGRENFWRNAKYCAKIILSLEFPARENICLGLGNTKIVAIFSKE